MQRLLISILWLWVALVLAAPQTHAASNTDSHREKLRQIGQQQHQARELTDELKEEIDALLEEQVELKNDLVELASELKAQEQALLEVEQKEQAAEKELTQAIAALDSRRSELEAMVQAAVRLSQIPPEAMVMMPKMSADTMQMARTMSIMAETLRLRTAELKTHITQLHETRARLKTLRSNTAKQLARVSKKRRGLSKKVSQRTALTKKLHAQIGQENSRIKELAKQAKDLKGLIAALDKKKASTGVATKVKDAVAYVESAIYSGGSKGKIRAFASHKGKLRAPAAGQLVGHFNTKSTDELSKGMTIATTSGSSVNAAFDGKVAYVGEFRGYGNMVILKHAQNYYTLMAGLEDISASQGEVLLEGEPLGAMGSGTKKLYVELRKNSEPINPKGWFVGL